jgi:hypothetical protein
VKNTLINKGDSSLFSSVVKSAKKQGSEDGAGSMPLSNSSGIEHRIVLFLAALFTKQGYFARFSGVFG